VHPSHAHRVLHSVPTRRSSDLRLRESEHHQNGGRLARTVWSEQSKNFTFSNRQIQVIHRRKFAVLLGKAFKFDNGLIHRLPPSRSEEHTYELQSRENLVCRLLL